MADSIERYFLKYSWTHSCPKQCPKCSPNGYFHYWQHFVARRRIENAFDPFAKHNFAVQLGSVWPSCWSGSSITVPCCFLKKKSFFAKRIKNIVFYCKWCFFIHYDSHSSGSVLSPSLSHAIRSVNDYMARKVFPNGPLDRCRLVIKLRFPE